jgi:hypothetical protein
MRCVGEEEDTLDRLRLWSCILFVSAQLNGAFGDEFDCSVIADCPIDGGLAAAGGGKTDCITPSEVNAAPPNDG